MVDFSDLRITEFTSIFMSDILMSIDEDFLRRQDKIPPKKSRKLTKTNRPEITTSLYDFFLQQKRSPPTANSEDVLDLGLHQTIQT